MGFILAIISMKDHEVITALAVAIPYWYWTPIIGTMFAIFRRILHGKPIGEADRGHLHHRLLDMGLTIVWLLLAYIVVEHWACINCFS